MTQYPIFTDADQRWIDLQMVAALKAELAGNPKRAAWLRSLVDPRLPIVIKPKGKAGKTHT